MSEMSRAELTEVILAAVHEINIENAEKSKPVYTLAEMLSIKNITSLRKLGKLYKVSGFSKMDKPSVIPALIEKMTDINLLTELLFMAAEFEWKLFKQAAKVKHVLDDDLFSENYQFLFKLGILGMYYYDDHFYYVIPAEIQQVYQELAAAGFPAEKEHADLLNAYAIAAANLYGVISQDDFVKLFNSQNKRKTNIDEMFGVLIKFVSMDYGYCFWGEYLVNDDFEENDYKDVENYARVAAAKPRYIPSKQEFLKYADWDYIEQTPQLIRLRAYINHNLTDDPELTEDILEELCFLAKSEAKPQSYVDVFEENEIFFEVEQIQVLMGLIMELCNHTRLWLNNGHTPNELFAEERKHLRPLPEVPLKVVKVGRNEPCPCGSGKKYKNCCGR